MSERNSNWDPEQYRVEYYNWLIDGKLAQIEASAKGTNASFLSYVTDDEGKYSSEKMKLFIAKLLSMSKYPLLQKEKEMYEAFFFCAIYCFANDRIKDVDGDYREYKRCSRFCELIDRARFFTRDSDRYSSYESLLREEFTNYSEDCPTNSISRAYITDPSVYGCNTFFSTLDGYFLYCLDECVEEIDRESFTFYKEKFLKEEYDNYEMYSSLIPDDALTGGAFADTNNKTIEVKETSTDKPEAMEQEKKPFLDLKWTAEKKSEKELSWKEIGKYLPSRDEFLEKYRQLRTLFFENHRIHAFEVEYMILHFMYSEGIGCFHDAGLMVDVLNSLKRSNSQVAGTVNRRRR